MASARCEWDFAEHDDEAACAFITQVGGNRLNGCSLGEPLQGQDDVKLLPPATETHAGLLKHQPAKGPLADPDALRPLMHGPPVGPVGGHRVCKPPQTAIRRHREMQLFHRRGGEFIEQNLLMRSRRKQCIVQPTWTAPASALVKIME